jgi:hypothetical protein
MQSVSNARERLRLLTALYSFHARRLPCRKRRLPHLRRCDRVRRDRKKTAYDGDREYHFFRLDDPSLPELCR